MKKMLLALAVFALVMAPLAGMADTCYVYVNEADFTGFRTSAGGGITADGSWATSGNFTIAWNITGGSGDPYKYEYTITALGTGGGLSHWIMQVSQGFKFVGDPSGDFGAALGPQYWDSGEGNSNPGMPTSIFGIKFDETSPVNGVTKITFESFNAPVWGDFYAKGGQTYAYNDFFGVSACGASDFTGWIVVPDSVKTPLPGSLLLLGSGLLGLVGLRRKLQ